MNDVSDYSFIQDWVINSKIIDPSSNQVVEMEQLNGLSHKYSLSQLHRSYITPTHVTYSTYSVYITQYKSALFLVVLSNLTADS